MAPSSSSSSSIFILNRSNLNVVGSVIVVGLVLAYVLSLAICISHIEQIPASSGVSNLSLFASSLSSSSSSSSSSLIGIQHHQQHQQHQQQHLDHHDRTISPLPSELSSQSSKTDGFKILEELALKEKLDSSTLPYDERLVVIITPLGNSSSYVGKSAEATTPTTTGTRRRSSPGGSGSSSVRDGYADGSDDTYTLRCSLKKQGYEHVVEASFDDSLGYGSLTLEKIRAIQRVVDQLSSSSSSSSSSTTTTITTALSSKKKKKKNIDSSTIVVVVDAFDVIFQKPPSAIIRKYDEQEYPIVFGGDPSCWDPATSDIHSKVSTPFCSLPQEQRTRSKEYEQRKQRQSEGPTSEESSSSSSSSLFPFLYLNSGVFISTLGTLRRFLHQALDIDELPTTSAHGVASWNGKNDRESLNAPKNGTQNQPLLTVNDQAYWSYWYAAGRYNNVIGIDHHHESFIRNVVGKDMKHTTNFHMNKGVFVTSTLPKKGGGGGAVGKKGEPAILHFPGKDAKQFRLYKQSKEYYRRLMTVNGTCEQL